MKNKKITKTVLSGLVVAAMVPAVSAPLTANAEEKGKPADTNNCDKTERDWRGRTVTVTFYDVTTKSTVDTTEIWISWLDYGFNISELKYFPADYELADDQSDFISTGHYEKVSIKVKPIQSVPEVTTKDVTVLYNCLEDGFEAKEVIKVDKDAVKVDVDDLTIPEGYELDDENYFTIFQGDHGYQIVLYLNKTQPEVTTKEITVEYRLSDEAGEKVGTETLTVDSDADNINTSQLKNVPEDYEVAVVGDVAINGDVAIVVVRPKQTIEVELSVGVQYFDIVNQKEVGISKVQVPVGSTSVNTSILTDVPEGYELVWTGDLPIKEDGFIFVEVRPIETTKMVGVNYYDRENGEQIAESEVEVDKDATHVNTSLLTDVPEGYELVWTGDLEINDGWVFAEVRKAETTKKVGVNYYDRENGEQIAESEVEVDKDAIHVNTSMLTDVPEGYELVESGDLLINDGWVFAEVRKVETTKTIGVNYWDIVNNVQVAEGSVTVDADATNVNTNDLTDVPEGYEIVWVGDTQINDGWIFVELRPIETTKTVGLNYWDIVNNVQVAEGSVIVDADATYVNTSTFTDVPEGYELVWVGDLAINDGWVWVEVRPIEAEEPETFAAQLNVQIRDEATGEILKSYQFLSDEKGTVDGMYTFVYGEDWTIEAPEGYAFIEGTEFGSYDVQFGSSQTVAYFVNAAKSEDPAQPGEDDNTSSEGSESQNSQTQGTQTNGTNTGVTLSLAGAFGTMSAALAGLIALINKKRK